jgi:hypothetical protein
MTIRIATSVRNAIVDAVKALIDGGSGPGKIRIYTGAQPATPATTASGTLLAEVALNDPSFATSSTGSAAGDVDPAVTTTGVADGTAGWFRVLDSDNVALVDGAVTSGEMTLTTSTISTGAAVTVTSLTLTQPAS